MSRTRHLARWWEDDREPANALGGNSGRLVTAAGRPGVPVLCPQCGCQVVYNGNYFCMNWTDQPESPEDCTWALPHPATRKTDRAVCDLIGIDYE